MTSKRHTLVLRIPQDQYELLVAEAERLSATLDYRVPLAALALQLLLRGLEQRLAQT